MSVPTKERLEEIRRSHIGAHPRVKELFAAIDAKDEVVEAARKIAREAWVRHQELNGRDDCFTVQCEDLVKALARHDGEQS